MKAIKESFLFIFLLTLSIHCIGQEKPVDDSEFVFITAQRVYKIPIDKEKEVTVKVFRGSAAPYRYSISRTINGQTFPLKDDAEINNEEWQVFSLGTFSEIAIWNFESDYYYNGPNGPGRWYSSDIKNAYILDNGNRYILHFVDFVPNDDSFDLYMEILLK